MQGRLQKSTTTSWMSTAVVSWKVSDSREASNIRDSSSSIGNSRVDSSRDNRSITDGSSRSEARNSRNASNSSDVTVTALAVAPIAAEMPLT